MPEGLPVRRTHGKLARIAAWGRAGRAGGGDADRQRCEARPHLRRRARPRMAARRAGEGGADRMDDPHRLSAQLEPPGQRDHGPRPVDAGAGRLRQGGPGLRAEGSRLPGRIPRNQNRNRLVDSNLARPRGAGQSGLQEAGKRILEHRRPLPPERRRRRRGRRA